MKSFLLSIFRAAIVIIAIASSAQAVAFDHVITFVRYGSHFIELTDSWFPIQTGIDGAMMAIENDSISTSANHSRTDMSSLSVHPWVRDGDDVVIHFINLKTIKRFKGSEVETIIVDRPFPTWSPESSFPLDSA